QNYETNPRPPIKKGRALRPAPLSYGESTTRGLLFLGALLSSGFLGGGLLRGSFLWSSLLGSSLLGSSLGGSLFRGSLLRYRFLGRSSFFRSSLLCGGLGHRFFLRRSVRHLLNDHDRFRDRH